MRLQKEIHFVVPPTGRYKVLLGVGCAVYLMGFRVQMGWRGVVCSPDSGVDVFTASGLHRSEEKGCRLSEQGEGMERRNSDSGVGHWPIVAALHSLDH